MGTRWAVARGFERRAWGVTADGYGLLSGGDENILEFDTGGSCTICEFTANY